MNTAEILAKLQIMAMNDPSLAERFLDTRGSDHPLRAFCLLCRELGYEIYEMDIIAAGEERYAAMKRATNGGGENSPMLGREDDLYEEFFAPLRQDC